MAVSGKIQAQPGASEVEQYMRGKKLNGDLTWQRPHGTREGCSNVWRDTQRDARRSNLEMLLNSQTKN